MSRDDRDIHVSVALEQMSENMADTAKSLRAIRRWIMAWSVVAVLGLVAFILLAMTRV